MISTLMEQPTVKIMRPVKRRGRRIAVPVHVGLNLTLASHLRVWWETVYPKEEK